jgi:uncharacterized protein (UPF0548 family)
MVPPAVAAGVVATAIGITVGGWAEWAGATIMALAGLAVTVLVLRSAMVGGVRPRLLLTASGLSLGAGMILALGWAWSHRFGWTYLDLNVMARVHGSLNAVGFGLLCLLGFHSHPQTRVEEPTMAAHRRQVALHLGGPGPAFLGSMRTLARRGPTTSPVGLLYRATPPGYDRAEWSRPLPGSFEDGVDAIRAWAAQRAAHITLFPAKPSIVVGQTLAFSIPVLRWLHVSACCRIIEVVDHTDTYGFTYATLPHHPEDGEESFVVHRLADGSCRYTVTAVWRRSLLLARMVPPLTNFVQRRTIGRYLDGVAGHRNASIKPSSQVFKSSGPS